MTTMTPSGVNDEDDLETMRSDALNQIGKPSSTSKRRAP
jgi:hypothetical protein